MSLTLSELERVRVELGYNAIGIGAEPYIGTQRVFDQVILPYLSSGAITTSSTVVSALVPPALSEPVALVLASSTGFHAQDRIWLDVDSRGETATVQSVSGNSIFVMLSKEHGPDPYPVTVEGGEAIVREILLTIRGIKGRLGASGSGTSSVWSGAGALKRADEVEWYGTGGGGTIGGQNVVAAGLRSELMMWRDELASVLGVTNMWRERMGQGLGVVNY